MVAHDEQRPRRQRLCRPDHARRGQQPRERALHDLQEKPRAAIGRASTTATRDRQSGRAAREQSLIPVPWSSRSLVPVFPRSRLFRSLPFRSLAPSLPCSLRPRSLVPLFPCSQLLHPPVCATRPACALLRAVRCPRRCPAAPRWRRRVARVPGCRGADLRSGAARRPRRGGLRR